MTEQLVNELIAVYVETAIIELPHYAEPELREALRLDLLESAVASVFQGYYTDIETRAGRLLIGLIQNHPLPDGNKRVAWITTRYYIRVEGFDVFPEIYDVYGLLLEIADHQVSDEKVIAWMDEHIFDADDDPPMM